MSKSLEALRTLSQPPREAESLAEYIEGVIERASRNVQEAMREKTELRSRKPKGYTEKVLKAEKRHSAAVAARNIAEGLALAIESGQVDLTKGTGLVDPTKEGT